MIKAVIFDYGNVVSLTNTGDCGNEMEKLTGIPAKVFRAAYDIYRFDFDRGLINGSQMYAKTLSHYGYDKEAQDEELTKKLARMDLETWRGFHQDVNDWALQLQSQGYKLGILSNMPYEFLDLYEKDIPIFVKADVATFSCRVHLIKPEKEIYLKCLSDLGVEPAESVFFDDVNENIEQANRLGMNGILWNNLEEAKKAFQKIVKKC